MKKYWKVIGISALVAGALYYPAMKLYKYLAKKRADGKDDDEDKMRVKLFSPAYRGKHKLHHRHLPNGDGGKGPAVS